jgi:hypothetical protein
MPTSRVVLSKFDSYGIRVTLEMNTITLNTTVTYKPAGTRLSWV